MTLTVVIIELFSFCPFQYPRQTSDDTKNYSNSPSQWKRT